MKREGQTAEEPLRLLVFLRRLRGTPSGAPADDVLGECERAALAAAVTLAEELRAQLTAIAVGPARREDRVLAMALRAGCTRALRVYDNMLSGLDYLGVARVLAATANHVGYDLILCGARSQDENQGAVGPAVAELLEIPHISNALDLRVESGGAIVVRRGDGRIQTLRAELPALVTVSRFSRRAEEVDEGDDEDAALDAASSSGRLALQPATLEEIDLDDLGLEPRELTHRAQFLGRATALRHARQPTVLDSGSALAARLRDDHVLD